jgi:putative sterol carrier protein
MELAGPGGGPWVLRVGDERCEVRPGRIEGADLTIRTEATYWLAVHRGDASAVMGLLTGRIRLAGDRRIFLKFPALFGHEPGRSWAHRLAYRVRRMLRRAERRA